MQVARMRGKRGQGLVEVAAGLLVLVPVLLAAVDLAILVVASNAAANLTFEAARAIASLPFDDSGVQTVIDKTWDQAPSGIFGSGSRLSFQYVNRGSTAPLVQVSASVDAKLPVPVPFVNISTVHFDIKKTAPMLITAPPPPA